MNSTSGHSKRREYVGMFLFLIFLTSAVWFVHSHASSRSFDGTGASRNPERRIQTGPPTLSSMLEKSSKHSARPPVGEFGQTSTEPKPDHDRRLKREKVHEHFYRQSIEDPGTKEVNGQAETILFSFVDGVIILKPGQKPDPHGLPVSATSVVVGTIVRAKAFVADNRHFVYSDYEVKIDQILKPDVGKVFNVGDKITGWVPGGSVHFPSGHIKHFLISGRGFPEVGTQYVLFLGRDDPQLDEYEIWTGYAMKDGRVLSLDADNQGFDNMNPGTFIATIEDAIRRQTGGEQ